MNKKIAKKNSSSLLDHVIEKNKKIIFIQPNSHQLTFNITFNISSYLNFILILFSLVSISARTQKRRPNKEKNIK
jgi:hypothetical protein